MLQTGQVSEAAAWRAWLLRAVYGDPSRRQILYGIGWERSIPESELPWLAGYAGSAPVRIGNAAVRQFQLDVYGEVILARRNTFVQSYGSSEVDASLLTIRCTASFPWTIHRFREPSPPSKKT